MRNRLYIILVLTALAGLMVSCKEKGLDETLKAAIKIDEAGSFEGKAGTYTVSYSIENAPRGTQEKATCDADWVYDLSAANGKINFTVYDNFGAQRTATITLTCGEDLSSNVTITQEPFGFVEFSATLSTPTSNGVKVTINPLSHKGNYFYEVMSKESVDSYLVLDSNKPGDMGYGNALYLSDKEYLEKSASAAEMALGDFLSILSAMYKVTQNGDSATVPYTTLKPDTEYYLVVYGMSLEGERTTAINLFQFRTLPLEYSDMTFTGKLSNTMQNQATFSISPSNSSATYYWTYVTDTDFQQYDLEFIMNNMIKGLMSDAQASGFTTEEYLSKNLDKGATIETLGNLMTKTTYHIVAWGMDVKGYATTQPHDVLTFTTRDHPVTDDCTFKISVTEVEDMDIKVKVEPSSSTTRYYVAVVDQVRCKGYNDSQMVERIINMETDRINSGYYGIGVTWDTFKFSFTGTQELWGRRDLKWTFEPEHTYNIYVFGVSSKGKCCTAIQKLEQKTNPAVPSLMTFQTSLKTSSWERATFTITPDNNEDFWLPFLIPTEDLVTYRYADGTLMEKEVMAQIKDYYEDEITQYVKSGVNDYTTKWFSETDYTLLVFGYAGTNTTKIYEFAFRSPEIPFDRANVDVSIEYKLFRGEDLKSIAPDIWSDVDNEDCVMLSKMTTTGDPAHWYVGLWPPVDNFKDSGGRDHLVSLNMSPDAPPGNVWIDKKSYRTRPWWYGATPNKEWYDSISGETLPHMPWSLSYFAADSQGNFGPWNYDLMIPVPKPKAEVTGRYQVGYSDISEYESWTAPSSSNVRMQAFSTSTGKTIDINNLNN